jgi:hypothetical protein
MPHFVVFRAGHRQTSLTNFGASHADSGPFWLPLLSPMQYAQKREACEGQMAYTGEISRDHPTCFLFVIDQSGSMEERMGGGRSKADFVADVLNKTLSTLVINCTKADGVRSYFDIGVIAYGGAGVTAGFGGTLGGGLIQPISKIAERPLRVEEVQRKPMTAQEGSLTRG